MKSISLKFIFAVIIFPLSLQLTSCKSKPKDSDILASVNEKFSSDARFSGLSATVNDGVLTLNGQCPDENCKTDAERKAHEVKEVKSITNNINVAAPVTPAAPVEIAGDDMLQNGVRDAVKDFPGVQAEVTNGEINLTGDIKRSDLQRLMMSLNSLKPKKINNKLTIK